MFQIVRGILNSQIKLVLLVFLGMILVISSALAFEHLGGYIPCALCLKQRVPYYTGIPVALFALVAISLNWPSLLVRAALVIAGLLLLWSLVLAVYHSGVEWHWWPGPSECGSAANDDGAVISAENLLGQLSFSKPPACDEAAIRILGLSFAGWNVVVSAGIALLAFRAAMLSATKT